MRLFLKYKYFSIIILLFLGLLFRLLISPINQSSDLNNHLVWAKDIVTNGPSGFYDRNVANKYIVSTPNYPPIAMIAFSLMYSIYNLVWPIIWGIKTHIGLIPAAFIWFWKEQKIMLPIFLKLPAICADIGLAFYVYLITSKIVSKKFVISPLLAASFILFNPAFFYNSAFWGQIDSLPLAFFAASIYYLLFSKNYIISALLLTSSLLAKQTVSIYIPIYALVFLYRYKITAAVLATILSFIFFLIIFLPFTNGGNFIWYSISTYFNKILFTFGSDFLTAHAFNFWGLTTGLGHIQDLKYYIFFIPARYVSMFFVGTLFILLIYIFYKRKYAINQLLYILMLLPFTTFLFSTRMHERHLLVTLPFLLLIGLKNKNMLILFWIVSLFHFYNLYHGWWSPNIKILIKILSTSLAINSSICLIIGIYCYLLIKFIKNKKIY